MDRVFFLLLLLLLFLLWISRDTANNSGERNAYLVISSPLRDGSAMHFGNMDLAFISIADQALVIFIQWIRKKITSRHQTRKTCNTFSYFRTEHTQKKIHFTDKVFQLLSTFSLKFCHCVQSLNSIFEFPFADKWLKEEKKSSTESKQETA